MPGFSNFTLPFEPWSSTERATRKTTDTRTKVTKSAKATKPLRVKQEKTTSSRPAASEATGGDRRDAVRQEREDRAEPKDKKASGGDGRSQKESADTAPGAGTTSDEPTTGVVETVVKAVKKIL